MSAVQRPVPCGTEEGAPTVCQCCCSSRLRDMEPRTFWSDTGRSFITAFFRSAAPLGATQNNRSTAVGYHPTAVPTASGHGPI